MNRGKIVHLAVLLLAISSLACSLSTIRQQAQTIEQTAQTLRTEVGGIVTAGNSLIKTAQAMETQHPGALETAKALATQGAPILSTIQAVASYSPGLVQTAKAFIEQEIPSGEPPTDIPIFDKAQNSSYFGSSRYIFYTTLAGYDQILEFYKTEMLNQGWEYRESDSHEYANAAQLNYFKDNRTATINISLNPLNNTTVVVINILTQ
jgi:hypothetical protein